MCCLNSGYEDRKYISLFNLLYMYIYKQYLLIHSCVCVCDIFDDYYTLFMCRHLHVFVGRMRFIKIFISSNIWVMTINYRFLII